MVKLTAYEIFEKAKKENITHEQYKQLLLDNGIIIKKVSDGKTDDTEQGALHIFDISDTACPLCHGTGYYTYGGSFDGPTKTQRCSCWKDGR